MKNNPPIFINSSIQKIEPDSKYLRASMSCFTFCTLLFLGSLIYSIIDRLDEIKTQNSLQQQYIDLHCSNTTLICNPSNGTVVTQNNSTDCVTTRHSFCNPESPVYFILALVIGFTSLCGALVMLKKLCNQTCSFYKPKRESTETLKEQAQIMLLHQITSER